MAGILPHTSQNFKGTTIRKSSQATLCRTTAKWRHINSQGIQAFPEGHGKRDATRFESELKDLTISEGKMLFKLINRETGNNCYRIIKDIKGPFMAWFYQTVAKHWSYDLKENYDPKKERMIELIIKELGPAYNVWLPKLIHQSCNFKLINHFHTFKMAFRAFIITQFWAGPAF